MGVGFLSIAHLRNHRKMPATLREYVDYMAILGMTGPCAVFWAEEFIEFLIKAT